MPENIFQVRKLLELLIPIRITDEGQFTFEELVKFISNHPKVVLIKEYKDPEHKVGPHYHGWAFKDEIPMITLRKHITEQLHCKGNEHYSFKKKKDVCPTVNGYFQYCSKGTREDPPLEFYNIKQDEILDYHSKYWIEWDKRKTERDETKDSFKKDLVEHFKNNPPQESSDILDDIILMYRKKDRIFSENEVMRYYNYISNLLDKDFYKRMRNRLMEKYQY